MATNRQQALPAGARIEDFEIRRVLGTGGFGVTYLGFDTGLERAVAIKEYCPQGVATRTPGETTLAPGAPDMEETYRYGLGRFLDEARTLARFHHPSIVRVHRFLEANGTGYLIMDFEEGHTLWQTLRERAPLDERVVLHVLVPILEGLDVVHGQRFLHRDIKPANILLRRKGAPVLLDFGAARLAMERKAGDLTVMLTPGYAPLEQYSPGDQQGPWSDIYALGATAYHCMTGEAPVAATERIARLHTGDPDPVHEGLRKASGRYSNLLAQSVLWMLEPVARNRPQDASELIAALRDAGGGTGTLQQSGTEAPTAVAGPDFDPTPVLTQALESTLEQHAGRVARRVVPKAVANARRYHELVEHLAGFVLDPERQQAFREQAVTLRQTLAAAGATAPASGAASGAPPPAPSRPPTTESLTPEVLEHATHHLAHFVGPIAAMLVEQATAEAQDPRHLHALLARELDDDDERRDFLARVK